MPQPLILYKVIPNTQKAVATAGVMPCMTPAATTVKKAALGRSKSPPLAVKKHFIESRSLAIPKGREFLLAVFGEIAVYSPFHHLGSSGLMIVGCITNDM